jgi:hypothetical protein
MSSLEAESIATLPFFDIALDHSSALWDLFPIGILVCDRAGRIVRHN